MYVYCVQVDTRDRIVDSIMVYDALQKRKLYLDAFAEGLEEFGVHSLICAFPEEHECVFTMSQVISPSDVLNILKRAKSSQDSEDAVRVWNYLLTFIKHSQNSGE